MVPRARQKIDTIDTSRTSGTRLPSRLPGESTAIALVLAALLTGASALLPESAVAQAESSTRVDSLLSAGRLQEAVWLARESGDSARAERILAHLDAILRAAPVAASPLGMDSQGVSYTFHLDHGGGVESIFKVDGSDIFCRACGVDREVASYQIDRLLGLDLTPLTVRTRIVDDSGDTLLGSAQYFVHDAATPLEAGATKPDLLRFFDALLGNSDRHKSNWLIVPGGRVVAIDHNRAFQYRPDTRPKTCWETEIDSIANPAALGPPLERYATLPDDSLAAAIPQLDSALVNRFIAMRPRVLDRIQQRAREPRRSLPHSDCLRWE